MKINTVLILVALCLLLPRLVSAHPSDSYEPRQVSERYGLSGYGYDPAISIGDLIFTRDYPRREELTRQERYILPGIQHGPDGRELEAWSSLIYHLVDSYVSKTGIMPTALTEAIIEEAMGEDLPTNVLELYKSPISGRYPTLNAQSFSPGDLFMRPLTTEEIDHFVQFDTLLAGLVERNRYVDPETNAFAAGKLNGKVFYMRIYGQRKMISTNLRFTWSPQ